MGNTLITYRDKYYEYDGDQEISNKCLTIGGYESALQVRTVLQLAMVINRNTSKVLELPPIWIKVVRVQ